MGIYTVTNTDDDGAGSLREAIQLANGNYGADDIVFTAGLTGTITLSLANGQLQLTDDVTINGDTNGDRKADITVSGGGVTRVFETGNQYTGTDVTLRSLTITNGYAEFQGGAIFFGGGGTLNIVDSTISDSGTGGTGGGLYADYANVNISNSLITGNTATGKGGGFTNYGGNTTILNTTIHGNQAGGAGGGIYKNAGEDVLGSGNTGDLFIVNSTITNNTSATGAGGLVANGEDRFHNNVITGNTGGDVAGTLEFAYTNAFGGGATVTTGVGNQFNAVNTGLGALADNGGPVLTRAIVNASSVLINAGSNGFAQFFNLTTDATGAPRVQGGTVDIGATEAPLILVTTAADTVANDGLTSLREAVTLSNATAGTQFIRFAANLAGSTITLNGQLTLTSDAAISGDVNGDKKADITVSGNFANRIFDITGATTDVDLLSLTLTDGLGDDGGAVRAQSIASLDIVDSTITGNQATARGGGVFTNYVTTLRIANSLITGNVATTGGGLYTRVTTATLTNATVHGNESDSFDGGISSVYATVNLLDSTITGNRADANGDTYGSAGGMGIFNSAVTIANTVIADNFVGIGAVENDVLGTIATANNSIFGTAVTITGGSGNQTGVANVGLGALLDNGGTVFTRSPLDGSVLIGTGSIAAVPLDVHDLDGDGNAGERLPLDGRRDFRIRFGTVDVGAVEQKLDETIGGTALTDTIIGGLGNDILRGRGGSDTLDGGGGTADTADYSLAAATGVTVDLSILVAQAVSASEGSDTLIGIENVIGSTRNDSLTDAAGVNRLDGIAGNDTFFLKADAATDTVVGGDGTLDSLNFFFATSGVTVGFGATAFAGTATGGGQGTTAFTGIERVIGGNFGDTIVGGTGGEALFGRGGNDAINGGGGADQIFGEAGNDTLNDGAGIDSADGGVGADTFFMVADGVADTVAGGADIDNLDLFFATGATVTTFGATAFAGTASGGGQGTTNFTGIERVVGGNFADTITGSTGAETFYGRAGADRLTGVQGADTIFGGADADRFVFGHLAHGGDTFGDFATTIDKIEIARVGFGLAPAYVLNFQVGAAAVGAGQVFLFNPATKQFIFDSNGAAGGGTTLLATLSVGSVAAGDIVLV